MSRHSAHHKPGVLSQYENDFTEALQQGKGETAAKTKRFAKRGREFAMREVGIGAAYPCEVRKSYLALQRQQYGRTGCHFDSNAEVQPAYATRSTVTQVIEWGCDGCPNMLKAKRWLKQPDAEWRVQSGPSTKESDLCVRKLVEGTKFGPHYKRKEGPDSEDEYEVPAPKRSRLDASYRPSPEPKPKVGRGRGRKLKLPSPDEDSCFNCGFLALPGEPGFEELLECHKCLASGHQVCWATPAETFERCLNYKDWSCPSCSVCCVCKSKRTKVEDDEGLMCAGCDKMYHRACLPDPRADIPEGEENSTQ
jgi:hypothetical protein